MNNMTHEHRNKMITEILNGGGELEDVRKYGTVLEYVEAIKPLYEETRQNIKEMKGFTDEQCDQIADSYGELKDNFEDMVMDSLEPSFDRIVKGFKKMALQMRVSKHIKPISKEHAIQNLTAISMKQVFSRLTSSERILIKGLCLETLDNEELKSVTKAIEYLSGASAEEIIKNQKIDIEDKYLIFSKYDKSVNESALIKNRGVLSMLYEMLPDHMRDEVFKGKNIGDTLEIKVNKYGDYRHKKNNEAKEKFYIDSFILKFTHVGLHGMNPTEFNKERFEHPDCPCATVKALADAISRVKKEYFIPNPLGRKS